MILEYSLKVGSETHSIQAEDFIEALKKLNEKLNLTLTENEVRINSVIKIKD
jgi:16S rRNA G527 N7-methylase RsmG